MNNLSFDFLQLLIVSDNFLNEHLIPVVLDYLSHNFRCVWFEFSEDFFWHNGISPRCVCVSRIVIEWNVLFPYLRQHIMDIEIFINIIVRKFWIIHIWVRFSKIIEKEVDGSHNFRFPCKMLNQICVLSGFEEVNVEVNGIFFWIERS